MERLSWKAPWTKRAPRSPATILARSSKGIGWRIWAWAKLVKVWASLGGRIFRREMTLLPSGEG